ncbi:MULTISPECIES: DUF3558 family protein [unclassified Saccharopolyspora]|uniref:DUF3558 family protein n=1 Tax=unclassified Saccharopolyspora TaxID=2646250 RepID=UPI001CD80033|nr:MULTISPECIES: DUF3558 family protein [unclassified Saccharopolyspora]MCA1187312.1 DUF3558 domain-containing protein [Saccharopolyspora sp. 6T]MCA1193635.1 DUF3558 domain-containing protein [Saccharopolyspora sp. 6V]MCA1282825.1 DUF3558 domain-containing protein [Saccharopolyspora sp. 7B]
MNAIPRKAGLALLAVGMLASVSGCALDSRADGESAVEEPVRTVGLAKVDPCTMLTEQELAARGGRPPGYPNNDIAAEPGCDFDGDPFGYSFYKNQEMTVERYGERDVWWRFERSELDGRPAAITVVRGSASARICSTMFDAGGGVITVTAQETDDEGRDECAESWLVAELIAAKSPR